MENIKICFNNGKSALFDRGQVAFKDGENFFTLSQTYSDEEVWEQLVREDRILINWDSVSYVTHYTKPDEDE